jgi:3-isopropylmalate dehydrogenase
VLDQCRAAHGVLFGAVGGPKWDDPHAPVRPEEAILGLRKELRLFANLRPIHAYAELAAVSPVKDIAGVDILFVRELTGGLYFSKPKRRWETSRGRRAVDTPSTLSARSSGYARRFELARHRRGKLMLVDKFNVLESSRLWRELALELASEYPDVQLDSVLVDAFAMQLIQRPLEFDVVVTENLFGDILTDEAAVLASSLGMVPSASLGPRRRGRVRRGPISAFGLYEPIHGSAPTIAGQDKANPVGAILSAALLASLVWP